MNGPVEHPEQTAFFDEINVPIHAQIAHTSIISHQIRPESTHRVCLCARTVISHSVCLFERNKFVRRLCVSVSDIIYYHSSAKKDTVLSFRSTRFYIAATRKLIINFRGEQMKFV